MRIRSRDVSDYQSNVKWQTVARGGIVFSFVKSASSIRGQINLFLKTVKLEAGDLPTVWDTVWDLEITVITGDLSPHL